jgi:hypothetical protein
MNQPIKMTIYIEWPLTQATKFQFLELYSLYSELSDGDPETQVIEEQIKSLPGFPVNAPIDSDFLLVVTDKQFLH